MSSQAFFWCVMAVLALIVFSLLGLFWSIITQNPKNEEFEGEILKLIKASPDGSLSAAQLMNAMPWKFFLKPIYPTLFRMEIRGTIKGEWIDGKYPRTRTYRVV